MYANVNNVRLRLTLLHQVFWSLNGTLVAIATDESFYVLRFDRDAYTAKVETGADLGDEGVEEAFEIVTEVHEK
jgi:coatomer subunit beta'